MNTIATASEKAELIKALTELLNACYPVEVQKAAKDKLIELLQEI